LNQPDLFKDFIKALKDKNANLTSITQSLISKDGLLASITTDDFASTEYNNRPKSFKGGQSEFKRLNKRPEFKRKRRETRQQSLNTNILPSLTELLEAFNNLNSFNTSTCPAKQIKHTLYASTTHGCMCQTIYSLISEVSTGKIINCLVSLFLLVNVLLSIGAQTLFNQLKPSLLGKIVYSPNTPVYEKVIKKMNSTFENLIQLADVLQNLGESTNHTAELLSQYSTFIETNIEILENDSELKYLNITSSVIQLKFAAQLIYFMRNLIDCFELNKFLGFKNESEAIDFGVSLTEYESFYAAIIFTSNETTETEINKMPKLIKYKIRMNATQTHNTLFTQDRFYSFNPGNCLGCNQYFLYGFIYIQDMLERALIETTTLTDSPLIGITTQMNSYPCYVNDKFMLAISRLLPGFMVLSWVYTVSMIVKDIVYEKEKRLKEFMRVMGLTNATHWAAWFITSFVMMYSVCCLLCLIIK
jgi:hypothetical protein